MKMNQKIEKHYNVVIVGNGVAGCFTALHLPKDYKILMITKSDLEESDSFLAQGGICVLRDDDDYDLYFEDTMRAGHYENRKESVDIMIRSSRDIINELIDYGVDFYRDKEGNLRYTREGAHSANRILYHEDITGREITSKLLAQVQKLPNVTLMDHTTMIDILVRDNTCDGLLIQTKDGDRVPVFCDHVMWACGGIGGIYENSTNFPHLTGDALGLSLRHGVKLEHVNYVQIHPTTLYNTKKERRFLISESVRGEGAHLYDKNGNRFADELLPRDVLSKKIQDQMKKDGTSHVWLDMTCITEVDIRERFPNIIAHCMEEGIDPTKEWLPVVPAQHYFMGGVWVDKYSHTTMKHLYAAGETACNGVHGANRLASNSLLESLVFAKRAALHMIEVDEEDRQNGEVRFFVDMLEKSNDEIQKFYYLNPSTYVDLEKFEAGMKAAIWAEIDRENAEQGKEEK